MESPDLGSVGSKRERQQQSRQPACRVALRLVRRLSYVDREMVALGSDGARERVVCRHSGLSMDSESELREHLSQVPPELYDETVATELGTFVRESSVAAGPGECLVGSTEVLESLFGKWKTLERQESQSGITGLILSLGALLGTWPVSRIQAALEATPVKHVVRWCQVNLPASVQSQRRITLPAQKA